MTGSAHGESRPAGAGPETVRVVRPGHPLHGLDLPVWGRLRLRGVAMVVLVLPDGRKERIPAAWVGEGGGEDPAAPVVAAADLLRLLRVISGIPATAGNRAEQAARQSPGKGDDRAARPVRLSADERAKILAIAPDLPALWAAPSTTDRDRKELLHALLDNVVITVDAASRTARLVLHSKGGLISEISVDLPKPRPPYRTSEGTVSLIGRLAVHYDDSVIAKVLNQQQHRTATGMSFTPVNVASIRKRHGISPCQGGDVPDPDGEVMSVHQAAAELGITASWVSPRNVDTSP